MVYKLGDTFYGMFTTHSPSTGAAQDADSTPTGAVYEEGTVMGGVSVTVTKVTTGLYKYSFAATGGNGFESGKMYSVVISATVDTVASNSHVGHFHCRTKSIDDLKDFDAAASEVDVGKIKGTALAETTGGRLAGNISLFFDNGDANTTRVVEDVGDMDVLHAGTAQAGALATIQLAATADSHDDEYDGHIVWIHTGTGAGQARIVDSYVGSTRTATMVSNWSVAPDATSQYRVTALGQIAGASAPSAAVITAAVWAAVRQSHKSAGSTGEALLHVLQRLCGTVLFEKSTRDLEVYDEDGETELYTLEVASPDSDHDGRQPQA